MNVSSLIALSGTLIIASAAVAQPVALDTFGPGNAFNPNQSHPIRGFGAAGGFVSNGYLFTAEASGTVDGITTALEHVSGLNSFAIEIRTGDANQVGQVIGAWESIEGGPTTNPIVSVSGPGVSGPTELVAGETYWILAIGESDAIGNWFQRETPTTSTYWAQSSNGFQWFLVNSTQLRAIRITLEGDPFCYPNCTGATQEPILSVDDFTCFINEFASAQALTPAEQIEHYANCDGSTTVPVLTVDDFTCFINEFAQGCP